MTHKAVNIVRMVSFAFAAFIFTTGAFAEAPPASESKQKPEIYTDLRIFTEVLSRVEENYVEKPEMKELVRSAIQGMLQALDPHSSYMTEEEFAEMQVDTKGEFGGLGIQIGLKDATLTVIAPIEDTPAWRAGVKSGDKIVKIAGESTKGITLQDAVKKLRGPKGTSIALTLFRESTKEFKEVTLVREIIQVKSVKSKIVSGNIGYAKITQFQERTAEDLSLALADMDGKITGLILDLRNNPGGLLNSAIDISDQFLPSGRLVVYTMDRSGQKVEFKSPGRHKTYDWPIVVLVNSGSASASEIVAGAVKDWNRGVILGTQTFGKGSVQTIIPLSYGSGLRLTTSRYYTPSGVSIQNTGIEPTIKVELTSTNGAVAAHPVMREKDLKGHLVNDQAPEDGEAQPQVKEIMPSQVEEKDDVQLQRAIDLLKSVAVFKSMGAK